MLGPLPPGVSKEIMEQLKDNMLVAMVKRAGGVIEFTVDEIDEAHEKIWLESDAANGKFIIKLQPDEGH